MKPYTAKELMLPFPIAVANEGLLVVKHRKVQVVFDKNMDIVLITRKEKTLKQLMQLLNG
jgi:hypothetical protein